MRRIVIALLLASTFAPVAAFAQNESHVRGVRAETERSERADQREKAREVRAQRVDQVDRSQPDTSATSTETVGRVDRTPRDDRPARAERPARTDRAGRDPRPVQPVEEPAIAQPVQQSRGRPDSLVDGFRQMARDGNARRDNDHEDRDWSHDWRKDKRYDWWHYRSRNNALFRLGRYSDRYGWEYRRWAVGHSLWPSYYGSRFWLDDALMYRLPPAYGRYRWVRYYEDALLVNIYTGHVVDTVYNFFW